MADENEVLMYKGHPLMRNDNWIYYGLSLIHISWAA